MPIISFANGIDTTITKSPNGSWTVKYKADEPINKISFIRNPDKSRTMRWHPTSPELEVFYQNKQEHIARKDRTTFKEAELILTPTYKDLSKDYAPFSPFSDGGMLFHSGRFFTCINSCINNLNHWKMTLKIPDDEHIIVNGKIFHSSTSWLDKNDGISVYVGKQNPIETDSYIALIDKGLPEKIQKSLSSDIPKMMNYFENKLGKLPFKEKPTLFASYAKINGHSSQGGTLPNRIFMHWNKNNLETSVKNVKFINDTLWFFGHEAAHLYQSGKVTLLSDDPSQSWLHEGHADILASDVLLSLYPSSTDYVNSRFKNIKNNCAKGLKKMALIDAAEVGQFHNYYTCGFVIHSAIENMAKSQNKGGHSAYSTWNQFRAKVEDGKAVGQQTFFSVVDDIAKTNSSEKIATFINIRHDEPKKAIDALLGL